MKSAWPVVLLLALPAAAFSASSRPVVRSLRARSYQGSIFSNGRMTNAAPAAPIFRSGSHSASSHAAFSHQALFSPSRVSYFQQTAAPRRFAPMRRSFLGGRRRFGDPNPGNTSPPGTTPPPPPGTAPPPGPSPTAQDQTPPPWATPGALIRTQGLGFLTEPAAPSGIHSTDAGSGIIALEEGKARSIGSRGLFVGPKDTLPSSGSGGASGRSAITPNAPASGGN